MEVGPHNTYRQLAYRGGSFNVVAACLVSCPVNEFGEEKAIRIYIEIYNGNDYLKRCKYYSTVFSQHRF